MSQTSTAAETSNSDSSNVTTLALSLGLGLGIPLAFMLSLLALCLACRFCPGLFWKQLQQKFWGIDNTACDMCGKDCNAPSTGNYKDVFYQDQKNYRQQYINDSKPTSKMEPPYKSFSRPDSTMHPATPSKVAVWTRLQSSPSTSVMSNENVPAKVAPPDTTFMRSAGSILVHTYAIQEQRKDTAFM